MISPYILAGPIPRRKAKIQQRQEILQKRSPQRLGVQLNAGRAQTERAAGSMPWLRIKEMAQRKNPGKMIENPRETNVFVVK